MIVEDNRADVFLIRESIEAARIDADLHVMQDGDAAMKYFEEADRDPSVPCPALLILDINLPKVPGNTVLANIRNSARCGAIPVVVVTSSNSARDREEMARLGVEAYFAKPSEYDAFMKLGGILKGVLEQKRD